MRNFFLASAAVAAVVAGSGYGLSADAQPSSGSYQNTCQHPTIVNGLLRAECTDRNHQLHVSSLPYLQCQGDISNQNGILSCNRMGAPPAVASAPNNTGQPGVISQGSGRLGGFGSNNSGGSQPGYNRQYDTARRASGSEASIDLYPRGYSYPAYGDRRYGDPQFDPRFAKGGYAYGREPANWVPIGQRSQWLEERIARGQREGTVDRREAFQLRQDLGQIENLEARYRRQGLQPRMMADLDRRFDLLAARIQYERNDGDHPRDPSRR